MSFLLCDVTTANGGEHYAVIEDVKLEGKNGALHRIEHNRNPAAQAGVGWHATESDLLTAVLANAMHHGIVMSMKGRAKNARSLYRVVDMWGYTMPAETPIALRLRPLAEEHVPEDAAAFDKQFNAYLRSAPPVVTFLSLLGGVSGGNWAWSTPGKLNPTMLAVPAFTYFASQLIPALDA